MAEDEKSEKAVIRLRLLVDKKANKVVLAEAGKEFVDVLFSFLTLPMGTIVRLVEKYHKNKVSEATKIGCFNNLYRSVLYIGTDIFMTKACKDMLTYPRSVVENQRKWLKLNIDDTEPLKYYSCPSIESPYPCCYFSNFRSSKCKCGRLMTMEFKNNGVVANGEEIFVSDKTLFTITDNLNIALTSLSHTLKTLKESGHSDVDQLYEYYVDADHEKVLALLQCLFSSETPFTDVFLTENRLPVISKVLNIPILAVQEESRDAPQSNKVMYVSVFTTKLDKKVLYIESGKDFVDLLFTFLVLPLNSAWKLAGSNLNLGCIDNLCESFNSLSSIDAGNALNNRCMLPCYYKLKQPLLDVCYTEYRDTTGYARSYKRTFNPIDPTNDKVIEAGVCSGFVKRCTTFLVSEDLTITPMGISPPICLLKKWIVNLHDIEEQVINITKAEATKLLRASFVTTNALNTVFQSLLLKIPKQEV